MTAQEIESAVATAGLQPLTSGIGDRFAAYLALMLKWNARLNLTAIRDPAEIVQRHFLECIQCAQLLPPMTTLLDFGSGAGFPGIPIALLRPEIRVTLGESQLKKAAFLREAVRALGISADVFDRRLETMEPGKRFEAVALRAVDRMSQACEAAVARLQPGGWLVLFATATTERQLKIDLPAIAWLDPVPLAQMNNAFLMFGRKAR